MAAATPDRTNIIIAEDFPIVMNVIKNQIAELGKTDQCSFCFDGVEAEQIAVEMIKTALEQDLTPESKQTIQPIKLMLLDF